MPHPPTFYCELLPKRSQARRLTESVGPPVLDCRRRVGSRVVDQPTAAPDQVRGPVGYPGHLLNSATRGRWSDNPRYVSKLRSIRTTIAIASVVMLRQNTFGFSL